jgi:hypothetical protein
MAIADIVCDAIFMYIHRARSQYREGKFAVCEVNEKRSHSNEKNVGYEFFKNVHIVEH